ncbi:hypothetical protein SAMN02745163_01485 [Clostridium cavendishii DSM 21758]|uniref:Uncharacterized protein n=1 Tax=Clostridium cavendishii DSM 21758 TaxID=1121302 RepID=A0A1M6HI14_9CLOT|nr:hypothetical protein [Clostridium cavendishii]SHJ21805.1 hypothetical protein SAMN02745163_01485 [Clostridium cavendishii DSM 21758]
MKKPIQAKAILRNKLNIFYSGNAISPNTLDACRQCCDNKFGRDTDNSGLCQTCCSKAY